MTTYEVTYYIYSRDTRWIHDGTVVAATGCCNLLQFALKLLQEQIAVVAAIVAATTAWIRSCLSAASV